MFYAFIAGLIKYCDCVFKYVQYSSNSTIFWNILNKVFPAVEMKLKTLLQFLLFSSLIANNINYIKFKNRCNALTNPNYQKGIYNDVSKLTWECVIRIYENICLRYQISMLFDNVVICFPVQPFGWAQQKLHISRTIFTNIS